MNIPDVLAVYADGGVIGRVPSELGGTWAYRLIGAGNELIHSDSGLLLCDEGEQVENNLMEVVALVQALERLPAGWHGRVYSDSRNALNRLFRGWRLRGLPDWLEHKISQVLELIDAEQCEPVLLDGHPNKRQLEAGTGKRGNPVSIHNVMCDKQCTALAKRTRQRLEARRAA